MMQPLVSLIMPIWNVDLYIRHSFESALQQTYANIEYILVDDFSSDNSVSIVKELLQSYICKNVKVYTHQYNKGVASARKTGLAHASGEYIIFLDSDDYFEETFIENMVAEAIRTQSDIVVCDYYVTLGYKDRYVSQKINGDGKSLCSAILNGYIQGFCWNKLVKRELYFMDSICFEEGVNMWEDVSVISRISYFASKVSHIPKAFIHYNQLNVNSYSTKELSKKSMENIVTVVDIVSKFFTTHSLDGICDSLSSFKLRAKSFLLINSKGNYRKHLNSLYPELSTICFRRRLFPFYVNFVCLFSYFKLFFLIDFMWCIVNFLKGMRNRYGK